jgi:hypothetical protein
MVSNAPSVHDQIAQGLRELSVEKGLPFNILVTVLEPTGCLLLDERRKELAEVVDLSGQVLGASSELWPRDAGCVSDGVSGARTNSREGSGSMIPVGWCDRRRPGHPPSRRGHRGVPDLRTHHVPAGGVLMGPLTLTSSLFSWGGVLVSVMVGVVALAWRPAPPPPDHQPPRPERRLMTRKPSLTNDLYRAARLSSSVRAARKGPTAYAKHQVRRKVYRAEGVATRRWLRIFGL